MDPTNGMGTQNNMAPTNSPNFDVPQTNILPENNMVPPNNAVLQTYQVPAQQVIPEYTVPQAYQEPVQQAMPEYTVPQTYQEPVQQVAPEYTMPQAYQEPVQQVAPEYTVPPAYQGPVQQVAPEYTAPPAYQGPVQQVMPEYTVPAYQEPAQQTVQETSAQQGYEIPEDSGGSMDSQVIAADPTTEVVDPITASNPAESGTPVVKSVLFLMNGFGMEVPHSFNMYNAQLMPSLTKLSHHYPFASVFASGTEVGLNKGQLSSFKQGFLAFSLFGKPNRKSSVVDSKMRDGLFDNNPVIEASINHALENKSRLHILFSIGERTEELQFEQLKKYAQLCVQRGVTEICLHLFLGDNSVTGLKVSAMWIRNIKYSVLTFVPQMRVVSVAGRKYLTNATKDEKIAYYRMIVSGVGEIWTAYEDTLYKKYEGKSDDDNMHGFLAVRENVLRPNDSLMFFNYDNSVGAEYLGVVQNPKKYFPVGNIPINVAVNSLFDVHGNEEVPAAFESDLPDEYFLKNVPDDRKILIIADSDRLEYISKCLNGFRTEFKPNISVWPIDNKKQRFELLAKYMGAYISQGSYDLIIADCDLFNEQYDEKSVQQLRKNMALMDKCLNVVYTKIMEKDYTLYATSFYGIKTQLVLTKTNENIDFSQKTPFLIAGKNVSKETVSIPIDGNFTQVAQVLHANLGVQTKSSLVSKKAAGAKNRQMQLMIMGCGAVVAILGILYYLVYMGYIG